MHDGSLAPGPAPTGAGPDPRTHTTPHPFRGNFYSVPPGVPGARVRLAQRLGEDHLHIVTAVRPVIAGHRRAVDGAGLTVRDSRLRTVPAAFSDRAPRTTEVRRPDLLSPVLPQRR
jgi:hypothetical protein